MYSRIERPYKIPAAARTIGVCEESVRRWVRKGLVRAIRCGRVILIPADEVRRLTGTAVQMDGKLAAAHDLQH